MISGPGFACETEVRVQLKSNSRPKECDIDEEGDGNRKGICYCAQGMFSWTAQRDNRSGVNDRLS